MSDTDSRVPSSRRRLERKLKRRSFELRERTKELRCVYGISRIFDKQGSSLDAMLQAVAELLPASWQFPDVTCARIVIDGREFKTPNYVHPRQMQSAEIRVHGRRAGRLEVGYLQRRPSVGEGPFLAAERKLIDVVAERLGRLVELRRTQDDLRRSQERLRELVKSLERAREEERRRIAHEIHDQLGHALMGMKIDVGWFAEKCPGRKDCLNRALSLSASIAAAIRDLQRLASELRPVLLDDFGLPAAISTLAEEFERRHGIACKAAVPDSEPAIGKELSLMLYRSVQELLTNVARHAGAARVLIRLRVARGRLNLSVRDNGRGITPKDLARRRSLGLLGIRERVQGFGGTVAVLGSPGKGTTVAITLPADGAAR